MHVTPSAFRRFLSGRPLRVAAGVLLFAAVRWWAGAGLDWGRMRNPDEDKIAHWIGQVEECGYPAERAYPGGWFQLFRVWKAADRAAESAASRLSPRPDGTAAPAPRSGRTIVDARRFNLSLHAGTSVLVWLSGLEAGFCPPAALFGAVFFAVQPLPVEFLHYCETDSSLAFSLALALWLVLRALRRGGFGRFALAMLAAGFAFSCKFTLAPLVLYAPVLAFLVPDRAPAASRRDAVLRRAGWAVAGLACFAAGFLAGTPALVLDPAFFLRSLPEVSARTYGETLKTLGPLAGSRWAAVALRAGTLRAEAAKAGWAVSFWLVFSAAASVLPRGKRRFAAVPLLAVAFAVHALFAMPWIRGQETLVPLVALGVFAGGGADFALRRLQGGARGRPRAVAAAVLAAAGWALLVAAGQGSRMLSAFRNPDVRGICRDWLRTSVPADRLLGIDAYAGGKGNMFPSPNKSLFRRLPEYYDPDALESVPDRPDYYLRNASFVGRDPNRTLWTRRLLPDAQARLDAFRTDCPLLGSWRLPPGTRVRPVFAQHDVDLHAMPRRDAAGADLAPVDLAFDRPRFVEPGDRPFWVGAPDVPVGPLRAVRTSGERVAVGLCAPAGGGRLRAVTESSAGDAPVRVAWDGPLSAADGELRPGGAVVAETDPVSFAVRAFFDFAPRARVRLRGDAEPDGCDTFLSSDAADVARALRLGGDPAAALAVVRSERNPGSACAAEGFLAARAAGAEPDPGWREAAAGALAACDALFARLRASEDGSVPVPSAALLRGAPLSAHLDFARARAGKFPVRPGERLPFVLPAGSYRLRFSPKAFDADRFASVPLVDGQIGGLARAAGPEPDGAAFEIRFSVPRRSWLSLSPSLPPADPAAVSVLRDVELLWDPLEALARSAEELRAALDSASPSSP